MSAAWRRLTWCALLAAFSPVVFELVENLRSDPAAHQTVVAPLLLAWCAWSGTAARGAAGRDGLALVALGLALAIVGLAGDARFVARLGLPTAVVGLARLHGRPAPARAMLSFGVVPIPYFVYALERPELEGALLGPLAALLQALGLEFQRVGDFVHARGEKMQLFWQIGTMQQAVLLAQLGWFAALRRGAGTLGLAGSALRFAAAALVLQPLTTAITVLLFVTVSTGAAGFWARDGSWATLTLAVLLTIRLREGTRGAVVSDEG